jgi:acetyl-CoA carboxylase carboxyl transferase subunit beta
MPWFSKKDKQIEAVPPEERVVKTENVFVKCEACEAHLYKRELEEGIQVCTHCGYHFRIGARERLALLFDDGRFEELDAEVISIDPLEFVDTKPYPARLKQAKSGSGLPEAIINARGKVGDHRVLAGGDGHVFHRRFDGFRQWARK